MAIRALSGTAAVVLAALMVTGTAMGAARADDPIPPLPLPSEVTSQPGFVGPDDGPQPATGPKTSSPRQPVVSPSPPSKQQIDETRAALERLRKRDKSKPTTVTQVAGPTADDDGDSVTSKISDEGWWTIGAGLMLLLVTSETTRLGLRRAKHRREA